MKLAVQKLYLFVRNNIFLKVFSIFLFLLSVYYIKIYLNNFNVEFKSLINSTFVASVLFFVMCNLIYSISWSYMVTGRYFNTDYLSSWLISLSGKYIPFKVGVPLLRKTLSYKHKDKFLPLIIKEQIILFGTSFLFGIMYFLPHPIFVVSVLSSVFFLSIFFIISKNVNQELKIYANYIIGQFFLLSGFIAILEYQLSIRLIEIISSYFLSSLAAMIAIAVPAGIGLRESIAIFLLENNFDAQIIINFLISVRLSLVFADVISTILGIIYRVVIFNPNKNYL